MMKTLLIENRRIVLLCVISIGIAFLFSSALGYRAGAQGYGDTGGAGQSCPVINDISMYPSYGYAGDKIQVAVSYTRPVTGGEIVWMTSDVDGIVIGSLDSNGIGTATVPFDAEPGTYLIRVSIFGGDDGFGGECSVSDYAGYFMVVPVASGDAPDLVVSFVSAPSVVDQGSMVDITYTVQNQGSGVAMPEWADGIYLSADDKFDGPDTRLNTRQANTSQLNPGESYTGTIQADFVNVPLGDMHIIIAADLCLAGDPSIDAYLGDVFESNEGNNTVAIPVHIQGGYPDLQPIAINAPDTAVAGQYIELSWTVQNNGSSDANLIEIGRAHV